MTIEIERKFLVIGDYKQHAEYSHRITQGYLSSIPERTVRVRIKGDKSYLTIKGKANDSGLSRFEWEQEISLPDAHKLLELCPPGVIDKTRYHVRAGEHLFEVDEFYADNQGLIIAEIELAHEDEAFEKPDWLGEEVTADTRYYNSMLVKHPYTNW